MDTTYLPPHGFRGLGLRSNLAVAALATVTGLIALNLLLTLTGILTDPADLNLNSGDPSALAMLIGVTAILRLLAFVAAAVFFLIWLHRAISNLPALGHRRMEFTPGWSVGYFFIPFANLVMPYRAIKELFKLSSSPADPDGFAYETSDGGSSLLGLWWGCWIVANLFSRIPEVWGREAATRHDLLMAARLSVVSEALFVIAGALAIMVVRKITALQKAQAPVQSTSSLTPPAPPVFS